jgi:hypothetical protein
MVENYSKTSLTQWNRSNINKDTYKFMAIHAAQVAGPNPARPTMMGKIPSTISLIGNLALLGV